MEMELIITGLVAYLLGSIPFGVVLARTQKINLTEHGSGNIGATNAARVLGKKAGVLTLIGDLLKGMLAVFLADHFLKEPTGIAIAGALAFTGHLYSVFLKFKGGKGVATGLGVLLYVIPIPTLCATGIFGLILWSFRYVSLGSILSAFAIPMLAWYFKEPQPYILLSSFIAIFIIERHHANIKRLLTGTENKFKSK